GFLAESAAMVRGELPPECQARVAADVTGAVRGRLHALHDAVLGDQVVQQCVLVAHECLVEALQGMQGLRNRVVHGWLLYWRRTRRRASAVCLGGRSPD